MERREQLEQKQQYADRQAKRFDRRAKYSLDPDNKRVCSARAEEWQSKAEKSSKSVAKSADGGIINTGAFSGAKKTPGWQDRHGKKMYEEIRHRKTDVKKISENTNFKESAVEEIKQHMFYQKHKFKNGTIRQFDYDFDQAQSWDRLSQGKETKTDLILLKHEYVELTQMRLHDYDYETAHDIANKYHNWAKAIIEEMK